MAYTSPSTALNQKLSEKVYAKEPTILLPKIAMYFPSERSPLLNASFSPKLVRVQNINKIVNALANADMKLTILAISFTFDVNIAKKAPNI